MGIFFVITKPHNCSTYQNRPIIPDNNQGPARVTAAGAASPDAAGADVARLDYERETERAYRIRYHLEVHVAQELASGNCSILKNINGTLKMFYTAV